MNCKIFLPAAFLFFVMLGCDKDDSTEVRCDSVELNGFEGKWYMIKSSGGFTGEEGNIEEGKVVWDFNNQDSMVVVTNNYMDSEMIIFAGPQSGTYNFSTNIVNDNPLLFFDNNRIGSYSMVNDTLIVDQIYTGDGFTFAFIR